MELITVKVFDSGIEAHILKARLESEDIPCFIFDENIVTLNPLFNFAVGGIKLKVSRQNAERALSIIHEIEATPYVDENETSISCPKCASTDLMNDFKSMKSAGGVISAITSFFFFVFPIYYKSVYKCRACDTEFKVKK